jgi:hypothetical protein
VSFLLKKLIFLPLQNIGLLLLPLSQMDAVSLAAFLNTMSPAARADAIVSLVAIMGAKASFAQEVPAAAIPAAEIPAAEIPAIAPAAVAPSPVAEPPALITESIYGKFEEEATAQNYVVSPTDSLERETSPMGYTVNSMSGGYSIFHPLAWNCGSKLAELCDEGHCNPMFKNTRMSAPFITCYNRDVVSEPVRMTPPKHWVPFPAELFTSDAQEHAFARGKFEIFYDDYDERKRSPSAWLPERLDILLQRYPVKGGSVVLTLCTDKDRPGFIKKKINFLYWNTNKNGQLYFIMSFYHAEMHARIRSPEFCLFMTKLYTEGCVIRPDDISSTFFRNVLEHYQSVAFVPNAENFRAVMERRSVRRRERSPSRSRRDHSSSRRRDHSPSRSRRDHSSSRRRERSPSRSRRDHSSSRRRERSPSRSSRRRERSRSRERTSRSYVPSYVPSYEHSTPPASSPPAPSPPAQQHPTQLAPMIRYFQQPDPFANGADVIPTP